jgi:hypothetical protein
MHYTKLKRAATLAVLALAAVLAGCEKRSGADDTADGTVASDSSRVGTSLVRLVNTIPSDATVDVFADDDAAFSGVAFMTVTPYKSLKDNLVTLELRPTGSVSGDTTEPLAQNREMLGDGDRYTVVVLPGADSTDHPTLRVLEEPTDAGEAGKARLRVVNAARGVETFDVYVPTSSDPFFDDVDFRTEAGFKDLEVGAQRIVIRADDNGPVLLTVSERTFEAGKTYTLILTNKSPTSRELEVVTIEDDVPATY